MKFNKTIAAVLLSAFALTGCTGDEPADTGTDISGVTLENSETIAETSAEKLSEDASAEDGENPVEEGDNSESEEDSDKIVSADLEEIMLMFESTAVYPEIGEEPTDDELLEVGLQFAKFYSTEAGNFFGYGGYNNWKYDYDEAAGGYISEGIYTDWETKTYAPMDYETSKAFMTEMIGLTDKGFDELCANSPTSYYDLDGSLGVRPGDGGGAGWDYNHIVGCTREGDVITFDCERVGLEESWGYDEDMTKPFTFRLAFEDDIWKLDGVSDGESFFGSYFFGGERENWFALVTSSEE
ncbi:MAG: hypothetical protein K2K57_03920 [Oscillospiraceae bacterium]|nr:hypothetical protein [Oscillospiraceae bacterium]